MKIRTGARRAGKTYDSIKLAAETGAYLVCMDKAEAYRIQEQALSMGADILFPITFSELLDTRRLIGTRAKLVIDNADIFLRTICAPYELVGISVGAELS